MQRLQYISPLAQVNAKRGSVVEGLDMKGRRASKHRRQSRFRRNTVVQAQLMAAPTYQPWFIDLISFLQVRAVIG